VRKNALYGKKILSGNCEGLILRRDARIRGLRSLPSVASLLASDSARAFLRSHPRPVVVDALRDVVAAARAAAGEERVPLGRARRWTERILSMLPGEIAVEESLPMRRVINAPGSSSTQPRACAAARRGACRGPRNRAGYSNLEFRLPAGNDRPASRTSRGCYAPDRAECAHVGQTTTRRCCCSVSRATPGGGK